MVVAPPIPSTDSTTYRDVKGLHLDLSAIRTPAPHT
nr:MAG TPA: hypothetical protein [Caudoviricetes sp.]